jgi:hypothetical protein
MKRKDEKKKSEGTRLYDEQIHTQKEKKDLLVH